MAGVLKKVRRPRSLGGLDRGVARRQPSSAGGALGRSAPLPPGAGDSPNQRPWGLGSGLGPGLAWVGGFAFSQRGGRAEFKQHEPCFVFEQTTGLVGLAVCESPHEVGAPSRAGARGRAPRVGGPAHFPGFLFLP